MRRDLWRQGHRTDSLARRRPRPFWLPTLGLALSLLAIGWQPAVAQTPGPAILTTISAIEQRSLANAPDQATLQSVTTSTSPGGLVTRSDTVTSSEPDYGSLNPVSITVTNPDHEHACIDPHPIETTDVDGRMSVSDACGAVDSDADGLP
jgi:hypothetical protein